LFLNPPPALVLASTSRYRRELLARIHGPFHCAAPGIDESRLDREAGIDMVARLARAKARAVGARYPDAYVIGSDQAASLPDDAGGEIILGKPGSEARCLEQLRRCSGRTLEFLTAVALVRERDDCLIEFVDTTRVTFRTLDEAMIARYVARESPIDCAGSFKSEGLGISLCESIDSADPSALIGLPLIRLCAALRGVGFQVP
jgi:septum formation protein